MVLILRGVANGYMSNGQRRFGIALRIFNVGEKCAPC